MLEVGALFLLRRAGMLSLASALEDAPAEDRTLSMQITQEMDGFPLALDQAGAYIRETPCTLATIGGIGAGFFPCPTPL